MHIPWKNIQYALRRLRQNPGFALTAVLSLALGIGANIAIFSLVNAILIQSPPIRAPEEVVDIYIAHESEPYGIFSYPDFEDFRDETKDAFTSVSAMMLTAAQADRDGRIEMLVTEMVSGDYFSLVGIHAEVGRLLTPEDDVSPGGHSVLVLDYGYWQRAFGGDRDIVGKNMRLTGHSYQIVGVASREYSGNIRGLVPSLYAPILMTDMMQSDTSSFLENRGNHSIFVKGRLNPGVTLAQAEVSAGRVAARLRAEQVPSWDPVAEFNLIPREQVLIYPPIDRYARAAAWLLSAVVGLVLLIACTNLAGFLLARSLDRRREIAIRLAMGATRRTLIGQLLTETILLSILGGAAGVGLSIWLLRILLSAELPLPIPITLDLSPDATVLAFSFAVSMAAGLLLGIVPALQSTNLEIAATLKDESAGAGTSGRRLNLRNALVVAQVAVALVLMVGAGLFLKSMRQAQRVDPGFGKDPAVLLTYAVAANRYTVEEGRIFVRTLLERIEQLPRVQSAGITSNIHLNTLSSSSLNFNVDGVEPPPGQQTHNAYSCTVDPGFFSAMGIPIIRGRNFRDSDLPDGQRVAIISEAMAERFWPGQDPLGRALRRSQDMVVVGIAANAKIRTLGENPRSFIYRPYSQDYTTYLTLIAKTELDAEKTALDVLATARELDPELWIWEAKTMERHLGIMLLPFRLTALLLSVFAMLGMALASVGLYGIVSYAVSQRSREVGIRMSLGADGGAVMRMLIGGGLKLVAIGGVIGLGLAFVVTRALGSLLLEVGTTDPAAFAGSTMLLTAVGFFACYFPARRAARVDPMVALRHD